MQRRLGVKYDLSGVDHHLNAYLFVGYLILLWSYELTELVVRFGIVLKMFEVRGSEIY